MDFALENVSNVVAACVLWEMYGDHFQSEWELNEYCEVKTDASHGTSGSQTASDVRNVLAQYLSHITMYINFTVLHIN